MQKFSVRFGLLLTLLLASTSEVMAQATTLYDANTTTAADGSFFVNTNHAYMQVISVSALTTQPLQINSFTIFGIRWNSTNTVNQSVTLRFFTNVDETGGATNALATANYLGGVIFGLAPQAVGSYNYVLPVTSFNFIVPSTLLGKFAVSVFLGDTAGTSLSTNLVGRFNTGIPSLGSNDGFIYFDNNDDGVFAGSERSQFNGATSGLPVASDIRMAINFLAVPEPATWAMIGLISVGAFAFVVRQRKLAKTALNQKLQIS